MVKVSFSSLRLCKKVSGNNTLEERERNYINTKRNNVESHMFNINLNSSDSKVYGENRFC